VSAPLLVELIEDVYKAARDLGLDPDELYALQAPWPLRADAWIARVDRLLGLLPHAPAPARVREDPDAG
jgi:hypothetical protein